MSGRRTIVRLCTSCVCFYRIFFSTFGQTLHFWTCHCWLWNCKQRYLFLITSSSPVPLPVSLLLQCTRASCRVCKMSFLTTQTLGRTCRRSYHQFLFIYLQYPPLHCWPTKQLTTSPSYSTDAMSNTSCSSGGGLSLFELLFYFSNAKVESRSCWLGFT